MTAIWRAKFWLGTFLATVFVVLSYEVKVPPSPLPIWLLSGIAFILSTYAAQLVVNSILNARWGRMVIMGKSWMEGYWYLQTFADTTHPHAISNDGITSISYEGTEFELSVVTYRKRTGAMTIGFSSVSDLTIAREYDTRFSNYFTITEGSKDAKGITVGKFYRDQGATHPNRFEGTSVLFSDGVYRRQSGHKIPAAIVQALKRTHGDKWMDALLDKGSEHLLELMKNSA